jgi:hypothetical protein
MTAPAARRNIRQVLTILLLLVNVGAIVDATVVQPTASTGMRTTDWLGALDKTTLPATTNPVLADVNTGSMRPRLIFSEPSAAMLTPVQQNSSGPPSS